MSVLQKPISASLSPNTEADDVWRAVLALCAPMSWRSGEAVSQVEQWFRAYLRRKDVYTFNSGRSALYAILQAFGIGRGDEVIVQAFTCVAVPNSVLWSGATPVYADIDERYNLDPADVEKKITRRTKAMIIQHTFGIPAELTGLLRIARSHNLVVIEDCAHGLGGAYRGKTLGTFGDAAFFSFGRDKVISSVFGGLAVISPDHPAAAHRLAAIHGNLDDPSPGWVVQQLLHPILFFVILPTYSLGLGKLILFLSQRLNLLSFPVYPLEKRGGRPDHFPRRYPDALARLLIGQLEKLSRFVRQRKEIAAWYADYFRTGVPMRTENVGASYLRFPMVVADAARVIDCAKRSGILLGNWYTTVVDPWDVDRPAVGYVSGSCPHAESVHGRVINLPTGITRREAQRVAECVARCR